MKFDRTIKTLLALIAAFLGILLFESSAVRHAQAYSTGQFSNLSFSGSVDGFLLFDQNNGSIYVCEHARPGAPVRYVGKLVAPGKPLAP